MSRDNYGHSPRPWSKLKSLPPSCAADRRLGHACLLEWAGTLDAVHPALTVIEARFGTRPKEGDGM